MYSGIRKSPRFSFHATAEITDLQTQTRLGARTSDLSRNGCYLDMLNPLPRGTALKIQLIHNNQKLDAAGHVVHSQPNMGMGVAFDDIDTSKDPALEKWLADLGGAS